MHPFCRAINKLFICEIMNCCNYRNV
ncbi:hypothetical protein YPPY36_3697, partial [Yersinia pestis PY-36]